MSPHLLEGIRRRKKSCLLVPTSTTLFVIAHPDDEAMFFAPALHALRTHAHVLCLSTGDVEGLGAVRPKELKASVASLGLPSNRTHVVDDPRLHDGLHEEWDEEILATHIANAVLETGAKIIITFDAYGVSGHPNHVAVHRGVRRFLSSATASQVDIIGYELETTGFLRTYCGAFDILLSLLQRTSPVILTSHIFLAYHAMQRHASQFVWYRRLFVLFTRYAYINTFHRM